MQSLRMRTAALTLSVTLVTACATSPDKIQTAYVSPVAYQNYSCTQIRAELERVTLRAQQLHGTLQERADNDGGKMFVGMVFFWPILFALEGDDVSSHEYARLKGERDALERLSTEKNCRGITIVDVSPGQTAAQAAEQQSAQAEAPALATTQPAPQAAEASAGTSKEARLRELKDLKDKGLVSDEVYREEQRRILVEPTPAPHPALTPVALASPTPATDRAAAGGAGLRPGDRWDYTVVDSRKGFPAQRSFEIEQADAYAIVERIRLEDGKTLTAQHHKGPYLSMLGGMQFAPYYLALQTVAVPGPLGEIKVLGGDACATRVAAGGDYASVLECVIKAEVAGRDRVTVPAGTFDAIRVHVTIISQRPLGRARQHIGDGDYWISPQAGRLIKATVKYHGPHPWTETMQLAAAKTARAQPVSSSER